MCPRLPNQDDGGKIFPEPFTGRGHFWDNYHLSAIETTTTTTNGESVNDISINNCAE